jgi:predicted dehydrogenase
MIQSISSLLIIACSVLFQFPGFTVSYESAIDNIPRFDAHIEVHSMNKSVRIQYDTPYVKGLPITIHTRENVDGTYTEKTIRRTYEDAYTAEMRELHKWYTQGTPVKTTPEDAKKDTEIFYMIMRAGFSSNS